VKSIDEKLILWEQRINERIQSKLSVKEWCEKKRLSRHQYHYWKRQLEKNQKSDEEIVFAEVPTALEETKNTKQNITVPYSFQVLLNNIQVTVPDNFEPEVLTGLMKVLKLL